MEILSLSIRYKSGEKESATILSAVYNREDEPLTGRHILFVSYDLGCRLELYLVLDFRCPPVRAARLCSAHSDQLMHLPSVYHSSPVDAFL